MKKKSNFLNFLSNENDWSKIVSIENKYEMTSLRDLVFTRPCIQINFDKSICFDEIKENLLAICSENGESLNYNGSPYLELPDYSNQLVEWHYDGISNVNIKRVPDWIFFLHSGDYSEVDSKIKNGFNIANCHLLLNSLTTESKEFLISTSQEIIGHKIGTSDTSKNEKADLIIKMVRELTDNINVLRGHIPFDNTFNLDFSDETFYCYPDKLKFRFKNLKFAEQNYLLNDIQNALYNKKITFHHKFHSNSLLVVHNKSCFHSGMNVEGGIKRTALRLQLIIKYDGLKGEE